MYPAIDTAERTNYVSTLESFLSCFLPILSYIYSSKIFRPRQSRNPRLDRNSTLELLDLLSSLDFSDVESPNQLEAMSKVEEIFKALRMTLEYNSNVLSFTKCRPLDIITGHTDPRDPLNVDLSVHFLQQHLQVHTNTMAKFYEVINKKIPFAVN